jgi:hypothetical protein
MHGVPTMRRLVRADPDDRWAAVFGRIAVYSFLVALVSGILLLPFFQPSMTPVVYHGSYHKLDGLTMSHAYQSTLNISFDVRGGLLIRQVHHWSADLFVAAVCLRLIRVFFRGRFRLPGWLIWVGLLLAGMLAGFSGAILPDDMLSGGSLSKDGRAGKAEQQGLPEGGVLDEWYPVGVKRAVSPRVAAGPQVVGVPGPGWLGRPRIVRGRRSRAVRIAGTRAAGRARRRRRAAARYGSGRGLRARR